MSTMFKMNYIFLMFIHSTNIGPSLRHIFKFAIIWLNTDYKHLFKFTNKCIIKQLIAAKIWTCIIYNNHTSLGGNILVSQFRNKGTDLFTKYA